MICIEGVIIPANWDNKGNVVDLAVATRDEEEYLITDKDEEPFWGAGVDTDIIVASIKALLSAMNRACFSRR